MWRVVVTHRGCSLTASSGVQQPDARYGCGYRNIQVMLSFLVRRGMSEREYSERIYGGRGIPSVASLQRSIEISWRNGFDVEGAAQLVRPPLLLLLPCGACEACARGFPAGSSAAHAYRCASGSHLSFPSVSHVCTYSRGVCMYV